jgi:hypothetical protein
MACDISSAIFSIPVLASSFLTTSPISTLRVPTCSRLDQMTPRVISEQTKQRQNRSLFPSVLDNMIYYHYNSETRRRTEFVTLRNGSYENEPAFKFVHRQDDPIGRGDLNGDGFEDAVVFLRSGLYRHHSHGLDMAVVLNRRGQPYNIDTIEVGADREDVLNIRVERGLIRGTFATLLTGGGNPTGRELRTYRFRNNRLSLSSRQHLHSVPPAR